jgi:aminoglycoside 6'-N-acetyltransferase
VQITTNRLLLRAPSEGDVAPLVRILSEAEVARWWHGFDEKRVRREMLKPDPDLTLFVIEHEWDVIGAIQYSEEEDPQYRHASVDLFIDSAHRGKGFGPEAIRAVVEHLFQVRSHHRIVIDPAAANKDAIRAYEKVGFKAVGVMQKYERGSDGVWHDGLLMELVR